FYAALALLSVQEGMRTLPDEMMQAAFVFVVLSTTTVALAVVATVLGVLGILVLVLDGVSWPVVVGGLLLVVTAGTGWTASRWMRRWFSQLGRPPTREQVFISYRTAEHAAPAELLELVLRAVGIDVYLAKSGNLGRDLPHPLTPFRVLGLFQTGGLDAEL